MNKITCVERNFPDGEYTSKNYEIIIPAKNCGIITGAGAQNFCAPVAIVVPPRTAYKYSGGADDIKITLEQALVSVKKITAVSGEHARGIAFAAKQAEVYSESGTAADGLVLSALGDLLAAYVAASAGGAGFSPVVETIRADISAHVSDSSYSLEDALGKLPLNYDYIRKLFKKETGATPHEYLLSERMRLAQQLILGGISNRYSPYSVSQIAEACGFAEPLYFSRVFKKYFGVSPANYK